MAANSSGAGAAAAAAAIEDGLALRAGWAYKYLPEIDGGARASAHDDGTGVGLHADDAAINVNLWVSDWVDADANDTDSETGGLQLWLAEAPLDWDFKKFNQRPSKLRDWLDQQDQGGQPVPTVRKLCAMPCSLPSDVSTVLYIFEKEEEKKAVVDRVGSSGTSTEPMCDFQLQLGSQIGHGDAEAARRHTSRLVCKQAHQLYVVPYVLAAHVAFAERSQPSFTMSNDADLLSSSVCRHPALWGATPSSPAPAVNPPTGSSNGSCWATRSTQIRTRVHAVATEVELVPGAVTTQAPWSQTAESPITTTYLPWLLSRARPPSPTSPPPCASNPAALLSLAAAALCGCGAVPPSPPSSPRARLAGCLGRATPPY